MMELSVLPLPHKENAEPIRRRRFVTAPQPRQERLPSWFRVTPQTGPNYLYVRKRVTEQKLHTVCEEARCPNIWECWNAGTATFMILGDICTRSCGFCAVTFGKPAAIDNDEPFRLAYAIAALNLKHAVITSVNRDELENGGAEIFAESLRQIHEKCPDCMVEVLIPDFQGSHKALEIVLAAEPSVLSHNIETVPRLYRTVRPQAKYGRSLTVLSRAKERGFRIKTGLMLGLGESVDEVRSVMCDLVEIGCDVLTLGQYLQPTPKHLPISRFVTPVEFDRLKIEGEQLGLGLVEAGPLVRSSYRAERHASFFTGACVAPSVGEADAGAPKEPALWGGSASPSTRGPQGASAPWGGTLARRLAG